MDKLDVFQFVVTLGGGGGEKGKLRELSYQTVTF